MTAAAALAQGTLEDYNRLYSSVRDFAASKVKNGSVRPVWLAGSGSFWYVADTPAGFSYTIVDGKTGKKKPLFDHKRLASQLPGANPDSLRLDGLTVSAKADTLTFTCDGGVWQFLPRRNRLSRLRDVEKPASRPERHWMEVDDEKGAPAVTSPDGRREAFIRDCNVWVRDLASGKETPLSIDGTEGNYYSSWISWSPDSRKVSSCRIRPAEKRYVYYVESSPAGQLQPRLHKQEYAKPGDELRFKVPAVFHVDSVRALIPSTELFASQYDISYPEWSADSRSVIFEYNERGHKNYRLLELDAETGNVRPLAEESHPKYVNYPRIWRHMLADGKRFLWASERDGYNHIYLYDRASGKPLNQVTKGEWYVREVTEVDEKNSRIYFRANGVNPAEDPYNIHYYRVDFDGSNLTDLTPCEGYHEAVFAPDMSRLVDIVSSPTMPPVATLRNGTDGQAISEIERADISALTAKGWRAPEVFAAPGRDGKTMMWGLIQRPTNFDPSKKYPVVEYIYQGPGDQYVPKQFRSYNYWLNTMAELGFITVMVDGLGTSFRSREFENFCYKNLQDAAVPDHMAWLRAAAAKYPEIDLDRVGIYGCSAGGQESLSALLHHPEFYKAAYSACGCHDNRMDKIWWNELWMGYPVDSAYVRASNVENAHLLRRPLMLVVGELDDNVDPASTMQVADALIKANKEFELVVIPGAHHTMGERYGDHKRFDFFVRHLLGVTPPAWSDITY